MSDKQAAAAAYSEWRLFLDGGSRKMPVRCVGTFDGEVVEIYEVWVQGKTVEYDILENLKPSVLDDLEAEAAGQIMWESVNER